MKYLVATLLFIACGMQIPQDSTKTQNIKILKSQEEWKKKLTPEEYRVLREKGTERPFQNEYYLHKENGTYKCAGCGTPLFSSKHKYDSGSGWPAYFDVIDSNNIKEVRDYSHGMVRVEVLCNVCDGHLGHVFEDGPQPTGLRYCINSISMDFEKKK